MQPPVRSPSMSTYPAMLRRRCRPRLRVGNPETPARQSPPAHLSGSARCRRGRIRLAARTVDLTAEFVPSATFSGPVRPPTQWPAHVNVGDELPQLKRAGIERVLSGQATDQSIRSASRDLQSERVLRQFAAHIVVPPVENAANAAVPEMSTTVGSITGSNPSG